MALQASLRHPTTFSSSSSSSSSSCRLSQLCNLRLKWKQKNLVLLAPFRRKGHSSWIITSVLNDRDLRISDSGATEPARIVLERLFAQTQKLEEQIGRDPRLTQVSELGLNLNTLESELLAALEALKKKEEDIEDVERKILMEINDLERGKKELQEREDEIVTASLKQSKIEEELKQANLKLASQATEIKDLNYRLKEKDREISAARSTLSLKEGEINKMRNELVNRSEEAAAIDFELKSKAQLIDEANKTVRKQEAELQELRTVIQKKEEELEISLDMQKVEQEKLKVAETNLEKQTMDWLVAQDELKRLAEEASKHAGEANQTLEDFMRVRKLLADVRSELVSSQKALTSSRQKMRDQEELLEKQFIELEEQRRSVLSYMDSLRDAEIEVESERVKLRFAEARNKELERDLSMEKELVEDLQNELNKERTSLQQAVKEMSSLQKELDSLGIEFAEMQNLLQVKESELVDARMQIQHLKSGHASLQSMLNEKDLELKNARKMLEEVNKEIADLRVLMKSQEDQLFQATTALREKEDNVQIMQHELNDSKLKFSEVETVVEQIVDLTNKLVISIGDEHYDALNSVDKSSNEMPTSLIDKPVDNFKWPRKQLEMELEFTRESLRTKEMEVLAAQRALTIKDEELIMVIRKLDTKEEELNKRKEEIDRDSTELRRLYALAQERVGKETIGDLAIEKLQLEAAQLEIEAATTALYKLAEMSRDLLNKTSMSSEADIGINALPGFIAETGINTNTDSRCLSEVKTEVARLSALTDQLVKEAGIVGNVN